MAATAIASAVRTLGNLLAQEFFFLYGVREDVEWVKTELQRMQCFLKDADAKRRKGDERVKNWVREVSEVAYRAEDVIDTFMHEVERRRQRERGLVGTIKRYTRNPVYQIIARYKVGLEIARIRTKVREISDSRPTYGIANIDETSGGYDPEDSVEAHRRISPDFGDDMSVVVGFDGYKKRIVCQLLDAEIKQRCVFSIVGMGGLGKTTLAKEVYNSHDIVANFPTRVWVTVSQSFSPIELFKSITGKAMYMAKDELERMDNDEVKKKLYDFLKKRKYLLVLDDIWTPNVWRTVSEVLPDVINGSRVLITSRSEEVAKFADPSIDPFLLPLLQYDPSWELFTGKVFPRLDFPEELKDLGRRMVQRCAGLPLALLVLGGILSTKDHTPSAWMQVEESIDWEEDGKLCMRILALSYSNLPNHYLRSCFLYIGVFPEDSEISTSELTRLWIAEGFIPETGRETLEDTARDYLIKLTQRSMIQVVKRRCDGSVSRFRIHDLLREMCLLEANKDMLFSIITGRGRGTTYVNDIGLQHNISCSHRLVLYNLTDVNLTHSCFPPNLRTLFFRSFGLRNLQSLKLMRVLELSNINGFPRKFKLMTQLRYFKLVVGHISEIPSSIGNFTGLQTLDLRDCEIPSSIGNFTSLQTLDLRDCKNIIRLPKQLAVLPNLRHLLLRKYGTGYMPAIPTSTKLQTLKWIKCEQSLPRLPNLRCLGIIAYRGNVTVLCDSIAKLNHLVILTLIVVGTIPAGSMIANLSDNHHLVKLHIGGPWEPQQSLPESVNFPPNLTKLTLKGSGLKEDPMPVLEKLPNLIFLRLSSESYVGTEMVCTIGGFPRLQNLHIELEMLQDWTVQVGAFPKLTHLVIDKCMSLTMLPEGLQHVLSLIELVVSDEPRRLRERLQRDVGVDWHKIKHVPTIITRR